MRTHPVGAAADRLRSPLIAFRAISWAASLLTRLPRSPKSFRHARHKGSGFRRVNGLWHRSQSRVMVGFFFLIIRLLFLAVESERNSSGSATLWRRLASFRV